MDAGHLETEAILKDLEKRIAWEYQQAAAEIESTLADYFKRFETKDKIWQKWVKDGTKTQKQYQEWRVGQMAMGQRWADQRDAIAKDLTYTTELAKQVVYSTMPLVYAENINYGTYNIEHVSKLDTNFTLYDRNAAASALSEKKLYHDPGEETTRRIAEGLEMRWNKQQIQSVMLQGLLQGESITKMSKRLASTVSTKDMNASIRNARTMTTGVQNAGRVDSYKRAQNMGIDTRKQWMATLDGRTRHSHRVLDGEIADVNGKFSNGCEFPGDPNGRPEEIYSCRCTLIAALKGFERNLSDTSLRYNEKLGDMSYGEWKKGKATSQDILHQDKMSAAMKGIYIDEYNDMLNKKFGRARSIRTIDDLTAVSNSQIIEMESYQEIQDYFNESYKIAVEGFDNKELFDVKATLAGYDDILKEFPVAQDGIDIIRYNSKIKHYGTWDENKISEVGPKGLKDYGTGVHEASHSLDFCRDSGYNYSRETIEQARKNLGYKKNSKAYKDEWTVITGMIGGSEIKDNEKFAYAMETAKGGVDVKMANEIYRICKEGI